MAGFANWHGASGRPPPTRHPRIKKNPFFSESFCLFIRLTDGSAKRKEEWQTDREEEAYRQYLAGDDSAFLTLIRVHRDGLTLYLNGFVRNIFTAEELMEEVFFRVATKKPRFSGKSTFKTWLYSIARNTALDHLRREKHLVPAQTDEALREQADVEAAFMQTEQARAVHHALDRLNPDYRQVLWLSYFEDFDNAQTAALLHKSKRQIENLMYRAKAALRTELEKEDFIYENL